MKINFINYFIKGKPGGKLDLGVDEFEDDEEVEAIRNSTFNMSPTALSSPANLTLNQSKISSGFSQYQEYILKLTAENENLIKEKDELKRLVQEQSNEISLTNSVVVNQQEMLKKNKIRIQTEENSHRTTKNKLDAALNDLCRSEKRVAELEQESISKRRKVEEDEEETKNNTAIFSMISSHCSLTYSIKANKLGSSKLSSMFTSISFVRLILAINYSLSSWTIRSSSRHSS